MEFEKWYNKNYRKLLILPAIVLAIAIIYIIVFSIHNGDAIRKDVSLTGGTTISVVTGKPVEELKSFLKGKISDFSVKAISDNSGRQIELSVIVKEEDTEKLKQLLGEFIGEELNQENSSIETTSASLSKEFYKQVITAVILAFFWMSAVVFVIFAKGKGIKAKVIFVNILFGFFLGNFFFTINKLASAAIFLAFAYYLIRTYIRFSVPAFAVILSAFADIVMTLAVVDLIGMKVSTAGIVAFLMLIGYSVDTDILLTTRLLGKREETNKALFKAFKTGVTMTLTSIAAVVAALFAVYSFGTALNQILTILLIGLVFDLFNTWITNASMIKWYVEVKK
ncbi:hypothetical protein D6829_00885 [Candidatus Pacearchaeota archaeon]|nr:MAG: hypothetical protein D6829_00885 [Candidatus Pacearchaeota archaeon]